MTVYIHCVVGVGVAAGRPRLLLLLRRRSDVPSATAATFSVSPPSHPSRAQEQIKAPAASSLAGRKGKTMNLNLAKRLATWAAQRYQCPMAIVRQGQNYTIVKGGDNMAADLEDGLVPLAWATPRPRAKFRPRAERGTRRFQTSILGERK